MYRTLKAASLTVLIACAATACAPSADKPIVEPALGAASMDVSVLDTVIGDELVLATVGGSRIGEDDLTVNMIRTLGDSYSQLHQTDIKDTMLQSMIASRAIAIEAMSTMDEDELASLEKRVAQFREELLVKNYLLDHAEADGITSENISTYYKDHPEEFAGQVERLYEIVTVSQADYKRDRSASLQAVSEAKTHDDWRALSRASLRSDSGITVSHSKRTLVGDEAVSEIDSAVLNLQQGQISKVIVADGAPYLVRLLTVTQKEPIPLEQARADIKRKLVPSSIRKSVKAISEEVLKDTTVVITALD